MDLTILTKNGDIRAVVSTSNITRTRQIMGDKNIVCSFDNEVKIPFAIGDYIIIDGEIYKINKPVVPKKSSTFKHNYNITFESSVYSLRKAQYRFEGKSEFDLVADLKGFLELIITNIDRVSTEEWTLDFESIPSTDYKNIHFSKQNCLEVLRLLCSEDYFNTEFYINDYIIHIGELISNNNLSFTYGKGNGLRNIARSNVSNKDIITRLYAYGSTKNLPQYYRDSSNLSDRLIFDVDGNNYVEQNTELYDIIEFTKDFDEIYPHRTGTVSSVNGSDSTIFTDTGMDFDLNDYLLPGMSPKIHWQTGQLAGFEFELIEDGYNHSTKTFEMKYLDDPAFGQLPNNVLKPAVGDKYVIVDIYLPQSYIDAAETELYNAAVAFISKFSSPNVAYSVELDPIYLKNNAITINEGEIIHIMDEDIGVDKDLRVIQIVDNLDTVYDVKIILADSIEPSLAAQLQADIKDAKNVINNPKLNLKDNFRIRSNWRTVNELKNMVFDGDNYFDTTNIRPLSIETNMLSVGSKSGNFVLSGVTISPNYLGDKSKFHASAGQLVHFAIDETGAIKTWNLTAYDLTNLTDGTAYYIYAKCNKTNTNDAEIIISFNQIKVDEDSTYFHFIIGVLHSVADGIRKISLTYGFTTINGGFITTGKIQDASGAIYFDLDAGLLIAGLAGIYGGSAESSGENPPRFFAGAEVENIATCPWQVLDDGTMLFHFPDGSGGYHKLTINENKIKWQESGLNPKNSEWNFTPDAQYFELNSYGWKIKEDPAEIVYGPEGRVVPGWSHKLVRTVNQNDGITSEIRHITDKDGNALFDFGSVNKSYKGLVLPVVDSINSSNINAILTENYSICLVQYQTSNRLYCKFPSGLGYIDFTLV